MPKFKVKLDYALWHHETYEVEILREDYDSDEEFQEALETFHEAPNDFCYPGNRKSQDTGDVVNETWEETVEEINALDQMEQALRAE